LKVDKKPKTYRGKVRHAYLANARRKRPRGKLAWINNIFLVMNLLIRQRIFIVLGKIGYSSFIRTAETGSERVTFSSL
jgi:hypothetical protein